MVEQLDTGPPTPEDVDQDVHTSKPSRPTEKSAIEVISPPLMEKFKPGWRFYTAFTSLCIITLAVALDATSLSVALPVNLPLTSIHSITSTAQPKTQNNVRNRFEGSCWSKWLT